MVNSMPMAVMTQSVSESYQGMITLLKIGFLFSLIIGFSRFGVRSESANSAQTNTK